MIVGLTGGIGSGKSTVAQFFRDLNVSVIDADKVAREVVTKGSAALAEIVQHFGQAILQKEGELNRAKLRSIVFDSTQERQWLEKLLHPLIKTKILEVAHSLPPHHYCVVEVPLLFEAHFEDLVNRILVVDSLEIHQIERVFLRDRIPKNEIQAIMNSQIPRQMRLKLAEDLILNEGSREELRIKVLALHHYYTELVS